MRPRGKVALVTGTNRGVGEGVWPGLAEGPNYLRHRQQPATTPYLGDSSTSLPIHFSESQAAANESNHATNARRESHV